MKTCKGCGAVLQTEFPDQIGYSPKADAEYCKRCFRLIHYDDLTVSMRTGINPDTVMDRIAAMDCMVLWVVDLADFEGSMIPGVAEHYRQFGSEARIYYSVEKIYNPLFRLLLLANKWQNRHRR